MARSTTFQPGREPFRDNNKLTLRNSRTSGPLSFLNPTRAHFSHTPKPFADDHDTSLSTLGYKWTSRDDRKGRHTLVVDPASTQQIKTPLPSTHPKTIAEGLWRMVIRYPVWDISFDVAWLFTWGSVVWVINGFFAYLPLLVPSTAFSTETLYGGGITAFIGATIFEMGSVLLILEAVNTDQSGCFGWALRHSDLNVEKDVDHFESDVIEIVRDQSECRHHHSRKHSVADADSSASSSKQSWRWYPTWHDLTTHYLYDLGFLASLVQLFAATVFWISGFTALPGIYNKLSTASLNGGYWTPQVIGGLGFVISGFLFMLEVQQRWYKPALTVLGWWIGFWNMIGGLGFFLCPVFGYSTKSWREYQSACSTFWGSWAFLIGSLMQYYESLDKYPVVRRST